MISFFLLKYNAVSEDLFDKIVSLVCLWLLRFRFPFYVIVSESGKIFLLRPMDMEKVSFSVFDMEKTLKKEGRSHLFLSNKPYNVFKESISFQICPRC